MLQYAATTSTFPTRTINNRGSGCSAAQYLRYRSIMRVITILGLGEPFSSCVGQPHSIAYQWHPLPGGHAPHPHRLPTWHPLPGGHTGPPIRFVALRCIYCSNTHARCLLVGDDGIAIATMMHLRATEACGTGCPGMPGSGAFFPGCQVARLLGT
jgi:hypothetical protein